MKRASYRDAIAWIAENDSAADDTAHDPTVVCDLITAALVAAIFDVEASRVGVDVVRYRKKNP